MDPITAFGLIAGALSVAEITTTVGRGCRHLQQDFSGALKHIELISQQTGAVGFAIQQICSIVKERPQTFPSSFGTHLSETTSAVDNVVQQIQDHVQWVRTEAATSKSRAKLRHVRKMTQVKEWVATLGVQIEVLKLLLEVAQLQSNHERAAILEKTDNKELFEKASSMSAKLTKSSRELDHEAEFKQFSFDHVLLESKVYRRVCESCWIREVNTADQKGKEHDSAGSASIMSVSSNSAIASERECPVSVKGSHRSRQGPEVFHGSRIPECYDSTTLEPISVTVETSAGNSSEQSGLWSDTYPSGSTLATTISAVDTKSFLNPGQRNTSSTDSSTVSVVVEGVGTGSTELVIRDAPDDFKKTEEAILHVRDRVLLAGGIDPGLYSGVRASVTIQATGQSGVYRLPLDPVDLRNAAQKLKNGFYYFFDILAHFPLVSQSNVTESGHRSISTSVSTTQNDTTNLFPVSWNCGNAPPHFRFPPRTIPPFIESPTPEYRRKGGFSRVSRATCSRRDAPWERGWDHRASAVTEEVVTFAVKQVHSQSSDQFRNELEALQFFSRRPHRHLIELKASYEWRGNYHFVFPWADGNLVDYWKSHPAPTIAPHSAAKGEILWFWEQLRGLAQGLRRIHELTNGETDAGAEPASASPCDVMGGDAGCVPIRRLHGRHGDIKPQNILWFKDDGDKPGGDVLKISDFGLAELSSFSRHTDHPGPERRGGTETYGAPELRYHPAGHRLTSAYDIWSLGCVFLEFACWLIGGVEEIQAFKRSRYKVARLGTFFEVKGGEIARSSAVSRQFQRLRHEMLKLDPPLPENLGLFLDMIESCFEVDESRRPSAAVIASKMLAIHSSFSADQRLGIHCEEDSRIVEVD